MSLRLVALVLSLVSVHGLRMPDKPTLSRRSAALGLCAAFAPLAPKAAVADSSVVEKVGLTLADAPASDSIYANSIASTVVPAIVNGIMEEKQMAVALCSFCALALAPLDKPASAPRDELDSTRRHVTDSELTDEYSSNNGVWLE